MSTKKAIVGGRVLTGDSHDAPIMSIIIDGDRISALVPETPSLGADIERIDVTGKLLIPGLVNAHTHGHGAIS
jgi:guanine deaminase